MVTREDLGTFREFLREKLRPVEDRLRGMVVRGVMKVLDDAGGLQRAQIATTADDIVEDTEVLTPPGFTARPRQAEALVFAVQGAAGHRLALLFDRTTRLKGELQDGEAAMYVGRAGQLVKLLADGGVEVRGRGDGAGTDSAIILKPNGDVVMTPGASAKLLLGDAGATKKLALADEVDARLSKLQAAFDAHVHPTAAVGPVSTPTPVPGVIPVGSLAPTGATNVYGKG